MKRLICILTTFICCVCHTASSESHIGMQANIFNVTENQTIHIDLYKNQNVISTVSDIIPGVMIQSTDTNTNLYNILRIAFEISPQKIIGFFKKTKELYREWIQSRYTESYTGVYTGPFFDKAESVRITEYLLSDLIQYTERILKQYKPEKDNSHTEPDYDEVLLSCIAELGAHAVEKYNPLIREKNYENNRYITIDIISMDQVIMTLSVDCSKANMTKVIISHKEKGRYYYRSIEIRKNQNSMHLTNELFSSDGNILDEIREQPFTREFLTFKSEDDQTENIFYSFETGQKNIHITMKGKISSTVFDGVLEMGDNSEGKISFSATIDNQSVLNDMSLHQVMNYDQKDGSNAIYIMLASGIMSRFAEIIPLFTTPYQHLFTEMILNR